MNYFPPNSLHRHTPQSPTSHSALSQSPTNLSAKFQEAKEVVYRNRRASDMSSPSKRRQTPRRSARNSEAPRSSSPVPAARQSQLASSPLFYQSSSPARRGGSRSQDNDVSSPLQHDTQTTGNGISEAPSSPLRQMSDTQSMGDRTPRASGALAGRTFNLFSQLLLNVRFVANDRFRSYRVLSHSI